MKISFCTGCMGRLEDLEQSLVHNYVSAAVGYRRTGVEFEFVVVDYNCPDDTADWILSAAPTHVAEEELRVLRTRTPEVYSQSRAKNIAHRFATGDILVNVDADNQFTPGFIELILKHMPHEDVIMRGKLGEPPGAFGRIAVRRQDFFAVNGYDEEMIGWGYEDTDFAIRVQIEQQLQRIDFPESVSRNLPDVREGKFDRYEIHRPNAEHNSRISSRNRKARIYRANEGLGRPWGYFGDLEINQGAEMVPVNPEDIPNE